MTRTAHKLTYKDGYIAGQTDAENNDNGAWLYDHGALQNADWKQGYKDGQLDARTSK